MAKKKFTFISICIILLSVSALALFKNRLWNQGNRPILSIDELVKMQSQIGIRFPEGSQLLRLRDDSFRDICIYVCVSMPPDKLFDFKSKLPFDPVKFQEKEVKQGLEDLPSVFDYKLHLNDIQSWESGDANDDRGSRSIDIAHLQDGTNVVFVRYMSV
jgi:hypothetical protein